MEKPMQPIKAPRAVTGRGLDMATRFLGVPHSSVAAFQATAVPSAIPMDINTTCTNRVMPELVSP